MPLCLEVFVMRIIDWKELKTLVPYSRQHIARMEKEEPPRFPKRVVFSPNRVGWVESEVLDWIQQYIDKRNTTDSPC